MKMAFLTPFLSSLHPESDSWKILPSYHRDAAENFFHVANSLNFCFMQLLVGKLQWWRTTLWQLEQGWLIFYGEAIFRGIPQLNCKVYSDYNSSRDLVVIIITMTRLPGAIVSTDFKMAKAMTTKSCLDNYISGSGHLHPSASHIAHLQLVHRK